MDDAEWQVEELLTLDPDFSVSKWISERPYADPAMAKRRAEEAAAAQAAAERAAAAKAAAQRAAAERAKAKQVEADQKQELALTSIRNIKAMIKGGKKKPSRLRAK